MIYIYIVIVKKLFLIWCYCVTGGSTSQSVGKKYRVNHPKYRSTQTSIASPTCEQSDKHSYYSSLQNFVL